MSTHSDEHEPTGDNKKHTIRWLSPEESAKVRIELAEIEARADAFEASLKHASFGVRLNHWITKQGARLAIWWYTRDLKR